MSRVGAGYWVWGGYHRHAVAVAVAHGLLTVPAVVGVPKTVAGPDAHEGRPNGVR